ncbi:MAG: cell envelope integrity EipB family protein [Xanthobacteraceae bacterium]
MFDSRPCCLIPLLGMIGVVAAAGQAAAQGAVLAPHRAVYELSLDASKSSTKIDRANGRIAFEVTGNSCQGYAVTLRQVTRLDSGEGRQTTSDLSSITWEDGAAKNYRFKSTNYQNQELRDDVDGTAERAKDGGLTVRLTKPKFNPFDLKGSIALPTEHLLKLLAAGAAGERILETKVFDGAPDGKKVYDTLAIIGSAVSGGEALEEPARKPEIASMKRYPVTVSYFEQGAGERTPAYVLAFDLYENGISRALKLDYGGFALRGELTTLELLKPTPCGR